MKYISLKGVTTNNLKNINIDIPRNKITLITGVSGSGKSSLAFDTIYAQAQKEYLESMSTYNRKDLKKVKEPKVESIKGLSPAIAIEQKRLGNNPRSTVGTYTEIYTFLRLLYSRVATPVKPFVDSTFFSFNNPIGACPKCKGLGYVIDANIDNIIDFNKSLAEGAVNETTFLPGGYKYKIIESTGYFDMNLPLKMYDKATLDKLLYSPQIKVKAYPEYAVRGFGELTFEGIISVFRRLHKRSSDRKMESDENLLEYNVERYTKEKCPDCNGLLLKNKALERGINTLNISEVASLPADELFEWIKTVNHPLASGIKRELQVRTQRLIDIGLEYLHLNRPIPTLSGGESQRLKLAKHLGMNLIEMIYVLDEPTIGLHPTNVSKIIDTLKELKNKGNTVIVVEHDKEVMASADFILDIGPYAGKFGGEVVAFEPFEEFIKNEKSLTARYLSGEKKFKNSSRNRPVETLFKLKNLKNNNLKNISVNLAKNVLNVVAGVSGAGKSTLIDEFVKVYTKSVLIDQSPIGRSDRSNPATYTGLFDLIRNEFAKAVKCPKRFLSFNSEGGCPKCKGKGFIKINMHFLEDMELECDKCKGKRYKLDLLEKYKYKRKNMFDILKMSVDEAFRFFESKEVLEKLNLLKKVGLGYIELGQDSNDLSGGEAQRIKLAKYLDTKGEVLILDEPTIGLHFYDIDKLLTLIHEIVDKGNTVIIVEHNTDVIKNADWIIELGPKGGKRGGEVIYEGLMSEIMCSRRSLIKYYLSI